MKVKVDNDLVKIDPFDLKGLISLMNTKAGMCGMGEDEEGNEVVVLVQDSYIRKSTFQKNHWIQNKIYWKDGTIEESYEERW